MEPCLARQLAPPGGCGVGIATDYTAGVIELLPKDLRCYSLFAGLADAVLEQILPQLQRHEHRKGSVVLAQGDHDGRVFFILDGSVEVAADGVPIAVLREGQQFGEMHLIDVQTRSATVSAVSDVTLLSLSSADLLAMRKVDQEAFILIIMNCSRDISRRLRDMNQRYAALVRAQR